MGLWREQGQSWNSPSQYSSVSGLPSTLALGKMRENETITHSWGCFVWAESSTAVTVRISTIQGKISQIIEEKKKKASRSLVCSVWRCENKELAECDDLFPCAFTKFFVFLWVRIWTFGLQFLEGIECWSYVLRLFFFLLWDCTTQKNKSLQQIQRWKCLFSVLCCVCFRSKMFSAQCEKGVWCWKQEQQFYSYTRDIE